MIDEKVKKQAKEILSNLKEKITLVAFTQEVECLYCSQNVELVKDISDLSEKIRSDMVEAIEFPYLAQKYSVMGVPRSIINENDFIEGAVPEKVFVDKVIEVDG